MPRSARIAPGDYVYHILTRGNNRQDIFQEDRDFEKYMELLLRYKEKYKFKLYHYVLMTNHVHLVLEPTERGGGLAEIMKGINLSYAQHYKRKYKHIGHFWQDRYKSIIISKDDYLLARNGQCAYIFSCSVEHMTGLFPSLSRQDRRPFRWVQAQDEHDLSSGRSDKA